MTTPENAPWRHLRDLEPPLGSKRRVIQQAHDQALNAKAPAKGRWILVTSLAAIAVFGIWLSLGSNENESAVAIAASSEDGGQGLAATGSLSQPLRVVPELSVAQDDELGIRLPKGQLEVIGPAEVSITDTGIQIHSGRVQIAGEAFVTTHHCGVQINGSAVAMVVGDELQVRVTQGHAKSSHPDCIILYTNELHIGGGKAGDLANTEAVETEAPGVAGVATKTEPAAEAGIRSPVKTQPVRNSIHKTDTLAMTGQEAEQPTDERNEADKIAHEQSEADKIAHEQSEADKIAHEQSEAGKIVHEQRGSDKITKEQSEAGQPVPASSSLRQQVESYKRARATLKSQPSEGLRLLQNFVKTWPSSLLREEAEALTIDTFFRLGRRQEASSRLRSFAKRHPGSTHIKILSDLMGEAL